MVGPTRGLHGRDGRDGRGRREPPSIPVGQQLVRAGVVEIDHVTLALAEQDSAADVFDKGVLAVALTGIGAVVEAGLADAPVPLGDVAARVTELLDRPSVAAITGGVR